jgi:integrase/recombinase XerD
LRGVLRAARDLGHMSAEDYMRAVSFKPLYGETLPRGRALTAGEIAGLLDTCGSDPTAAGARDGALIALLRVGGLRRAEICKLTVADYDSETGALRIQGKGNKERSAYVSDSAAEALADWLAVRGDVPGALFQPITKGHSIERRHMTPQAIYDALAKRARSAGVTNLSPHDFRRTFVSDLLDAGADISTVQRLAGHANVQTTARYDRRGEQAKRRAVDLLHVPYRKRIR